MQQEDRERLEPYLTNLDDNVFAIKNLPGLIGAVMARYSRAETGLRETLLREFVKEGQLNTQKADKLIKRVLIAYGDDSVGELEGAHLSFEGISVLATKVIEHRRIGGSPIEQSTRYIRYDFRNSAGRYHYHVPETLPEGEVAARYVADMDRMFTLYAEMFPQISSYLKKLKPLNRAVYTFKDEPRRWADCDERKQKSFMKTYENDIKTKTCDILRAFLPLSTLANVGLFGNGRYYQHLISRLMTADLPEANVLGEKALNELSKVIHQYVRRAQRSEYQLDCHQKMKLLAERHFKDLDGYRDIALVRPDYSFKAQMLQLLTRGKPPSPDQLAQIDGAEEELNFLAALVYPYTCGGFEAIRDRIKDLDEEVREEIADTYYGQRRHRRDRPERGIEYGYPHNFDMVTEWAVYKDLMRHRMGTIQVQPLHTGLGFEMPPEIEAAGVLEQANEIVQIAESLFDFLEEQAPQERDYAFLHGHRMRWHLGMNDRALMHMLELRSAPQGHPNYRIAAQIMHNLLEQKVPDRAKRMQFVNHEDVFWSRQDSEAKQRDKEEDLDRDQ